DVAEDVEVEKGLKKRGRGKVDMEKTKKKIKEQKETKGIPEGKNESSENDERQEGEEDGKDKVDNKSNEEDGAEDVEVEKGLKKRGRGNIDAGQVKNEIKELKETEPRTPTTTNRPVRERKSVKRLIESEETDASKEFHIEKVFISDSLVVVRL
ncbi:glutamic acid-rich protein-like, partial [Trifolium medium]|nr:glutamic acid-rich protein-like [Trifolium medium]